MLQLAVAPPLLLSGGDTSGGGHFGGAGRKFALRIYLLLVAPAARHGKVVGWLFEEAVLLGAAAAHTEAADERAHVAKPSWAAIRAGVGGGGGGGGGGGANHSALLAPIVALSAAAFDASLLLERRAGYELRSCLLPLETRAVNQQLEHALPRSAALSGLYFPDTGGSAAELPLLLFADVRDAAGDLLSHLAAQRHDRDPGSTPPPGALQPVPGTVLAFPAWAPCYLQLPAQLPARDVDTCDAGRSRGLVVAYSLVEV